MWKSLLKYGLVKANVYHSLTLLIVLQRRKLRIRCCVFKFGRICWDRENISFPWRPFSITRKNTQSLMKMPKYTFTWYLVPTYLLVVYSCKGTETSETFIRVFVSILRGYEDSVGDNLRTHLKSKVLYILHWLREGCWLIITDFESIMSE